MIKQINGQIAVVLEFTPGYGHYTYRRMSGGVLQDGGVIRPEVQEEIKKRLLNTLEKVSIMGISNFYPKIKTLTVNLIKIHRTYTKKEEQEVLNALQHIEGIGIRSKTTGFVYTYDIQDGTWTKLDLNIAKIKENIDSGGYEHAMIVDVQCTYDNEQADFDIY